MSRSIDLTDATALDDDEVRYALQRNLLTSAQLAELGLTQTKVSDILAGGEVDRGELPEDEEDSTPTIVPEGLSRVLEDEDEPRDYSEMTNDELRILCIDHDPPLLSGGNKAELIARLEEADEADEEN